MFGLGLIKGTIIGMGIGIVTAFALKEMCKMKKTNFRKDVTEENNDVS
jgi:F0F1-type ATP synthase assembly protein I